MEQPSSPTVLVGRRGGAVHKIRRGSNVPRPNGSKRRGYERGRGRLPSTQGRRRLRWAGPVHGLAGYVPDPTRRLPSSFRQGTPQFLDRGGEWRREVDRPWCDRMRAARPNVDVKDGGRREDGEEERARRRRRPPPLCALLQHLILPLFYTSSIAGVVGRGGEARRRGGSGS
jgi:hypothetical protein